MMRRLAVGSVAAAMVLVVLAGCGGSTASPSAGASVAPATPHITEAPVSEAPSMAPDASAAADTVAMTTACAAVGIRKGPTTTDKLLVRLAKGTAVRVVETVTGDPYVAGSCGLSGDDWIKIDRINDKSVKSLYGVTYGYAAGGFFK
jgi:hypothetical protein